MMRLNFRKVTAIAASALMVGMTMGVAAAANYPAPFVSGGSANVAVVYGTGTGVSSLDLVQAGNIQSNLQSYMSGTSTTGSSISGEAVDLGTSGTRIYIADVINKVKSIVTKADLPTLLADGSFSGDVDSTYSQTIELGASPTITFLKQPTSSDDPNLGLNLSTSTASAAYNLTVSFGKAINFSHADSEGQDLVLFGKTYTVGSATDATNLVLLQSAVRLSLDSNTPTKDVTVEGKEYSVELVSASDTAATLTVINKATGTTETKSITEAATKKINGIAIAVTTADENNLKYSASVVIGSEKVTLTNDNYVKVGEQDTAILGTDVDFHGGTIATTGLTKLTISITASDSDKDALKSGEVLVDPVFKTVKLGLSGFNIEATSALREDVVVEPSGDNKMQVTFTDGVSGQPHTVRYAMFGAGGTNTSLYVTDAYANISVREKENLHRDDYVVVGNEAEGHLLRVNSLYRSIAGWSQDQLSFTDVLTGDTNTVTFASNTSGVSTGTMVIGGKSYTVYLEGTPGIDYTLYNVTIDYPDSTVNNMIMYPTISTSKDAKLAFYEPLTVRYDGWFNETVNGAHNLTGIMVPNGAKTYQTIGIGPINATGLELNQGINITCGSATAVSVISNGSASNSTLCAISNTGFTYNVTFRYVAAASTVGIELMDVAGTTIISQPALMLFEGKDDNSVYEGLIVTTSAGSSGDNGCGVNDVERTWTDDLQGDSIALTSNSKLAQEMDLWGTIITVDSTDSDQAKATISYPKEQVYALAYMGAVDSSISGGTVGGGAQLGDVLVKDSEVSSVSNRNLVVVGGSCINSAAATLLGGAYCGSGFTDKTGVGSGQFLIQSFGDAYTSGKIALLVAGYEAADTVNAATYLRNQAVDTTASKKYQGTSATSATLVVV